jgi:hypothetical protein
MPEVLRFISSPQNAVRGQAIYLKDRWAGAWGNPIAELWAHDRVWSVAPSISTAAIQYRYGDNLSRGSSAWSRLFSLTDRTRWYVKIVDNVLPLDANDNSTARVWYGIIDEELHDLFGPDIVATNDETTAYPRGRQHLIAYGMEAIPAQSWIDRSAYMGPQQLEFVGRALAFNPALADYNPNPGLTTNEGNRSQTVGPDGCYVFHTSRTGGAVWTTRQITEYLLTYTIARNHNDEQRIPFFLDDPNSILPTWDTPVEDCEGRKVFDVLSALISRQRGFSWRVEVRADDNGGTDRCAVVPCSFLTDDLILAGGKTVKKNASQKILAFERDRGAVGVITKAAQDAVDQVVARGERRTSTATFSFADGTLAIGWSSALETKYEEAASTAPGYPAAGEVSARQEFNEECRRADKFRPVFARFVMPDPTEKVSDGNNGTPLVPLMPSDDDNTQPAPHAPDDRRFMPSVALLEDVLYDGDAIGGAPLEASNKPHKHLRPLVLFPRPNVNPADVTERYRHAEKIGLDAEMDVAGSQLDGSWSARVHVDDDDGALWVEVGNGMNDVIALTDFAMLPDDEEPFADYRAMLATLSVPWSFFAEARYPEAAPFGQDLVRRMFILAPFRRLDYVAPETIVGLDERTGGLLRSDAGGFIRDDREELAQIARLAFAWYGTTRKAVQFGTHLINNRLQLGDLIVSIGDPAIEGDIHFADINSIVTSIRLISPLAEGEGEIEPPLPRIEYTTGFGELDALALLPRPLQR